MLRVECLSRGDGLRVARRYANTLCGSSVSHVGGRVSAGEAAGAGVAFPLTYARYSQQTTTVTAGVRFTGQISEALTLGVRAGVEADAAR